MLICPLHKPVRVREYTRVRRGSVQLVAYTLPALAQGSNPWLAFNLPAPGKGLPARVTPSFCRITGLFGVPLKAHLSHLTNPAGICPTGNLQIALFYFSVAPAPECPSKKKAQPVNLNDL
jgi:hypothetical protein